MTDPTPRCDLCPQPSVVRCARCETWGCAAHHPVGERWCGACESELREAIQDALLTEELRGAGVSDDSDFGMLDEDGPGHPLANLVRILSNSLSRPWRRRRARQQAELAHSLMRPADILARRSPGDRRGRPPGYR